MSITHVRKVIADASNFWIALILLFVATTAAFGEDQKSVTPAANEPAEAKPFELIAPLDNMFGNWPEGFPYIKCGQDGITPSVGLVTDFAGNPVGGESQGFTQASNLSFNLLIDLKKQAGIDGASFLFQVSERFGSSLTNDYIGNVFNVQQVFGGSTLRVVDVAWQQQLGEDGDAGMFRVGRIAAGDDFLVSTYNYLFMQNGFDGNPVGIFFNSPGMTAYPNATWGAMIKAKMNPRSYVMAGVYNGDPSIRENNRHGVDLSLNGPVFAIGEVGYQINGLPGDTGMLGNYKLGAWFDDATLTDFNTGASQRGSFGFYGLFDQLVLPLGGRGSNRGLGIFGSIIVSPDPAVQQMPFFFTAGVAARGVFEARPDDSCGFGVVHGNFSDDLADAQRQAQLTDPSVVVQDSETALELTYRFSFAKYGLFVQPDIQYIIQPGGSGDIDNALVLGCQVGINF